MHKEIDVTDSAHLLVTITVKSALSIPYAVKDALGDYNGRAVPKPVEQD